MGKKHIYNQFSTYLGRHTVDKQCWFIEKFIAMGRKHFQDLQACTAEGRKWCEDVMFIVFMAYVTLLFVLKPIELDISLHSATDDKVAKFKDKHFMKELADVEPGLKFGFLHKVNGDKPCNYVVMDDSWIRLCAPDSKGVKQPVSLIFWKKSDPSVEYSKTYTDQFHRLKDVCASLSSAS